jgi:hypothetical protein
LNFPEYAVCTKTSVKLFDAEWNELPLAIRRDDLNYLKAITYNPVGDVFYFTDRTHPNTSIFSLRVFEDGRFNISELKSREGDEIVEDLIYDEKDGAIYYSDSFNGRIVKLLVDPQGESIDEDEVFLPDVANVRGLGVNSCGRKLYFTSLSRDGSSVNEIYLDRKDETRPVKFGNRTHSQPIAVVNRGASTWLMSKSTTAMSLIRLSRTASVLRRKYLKWIRCLGALPLTRTSYTSQRVIIMS